MADALEDRNLHVGLYLFGESILREEAGALSFRALKGPGAITLNTPRPKQYPFGAAELRALQRSAPGTVDAAADPLPDWIAIYPAAHYAMRHFKAGGKGFEMEFQGWMIAARPAMAVTMTCVSCHNGSAQLGEALGGVLYAYRVAAAPAAQSSH